MSGIHPHYTKAQPKHLAQIATYSVSCVNNTAHGNQDNRPGVNVFSNLLSSPAHYGDMWYILVLISWPNTNFISAA